MTDTSILILLSGLWVISSIAVVVLISRATHSISLVQRHIDDVGNGIIQTLGGAILILRNEAVQARSAGCIQEGSQDDAPTCIQSEGTCIQDAQTCIQTGDEGGMRIVYKPTNFSDRLSEAGGKILSVRVSEAEMLFLSALAEQNGSSLSVTARSVLAQAFDNLPRK